MARVVLAYPGDLDTRTGGYVYDKRLALELERLGWQVERLSLPSAFPFPSAADLAASERLFAGLADGTTILIDGLAFGAMPDLAARLARRLDLVALVHHPLCLETGLSAEQARALAASEGAALTQARAVVVTSPRTAQSVAALFHVPPERIAVAVPGTDKADIARGSGGHGCGMLYVATFVPRKGHAVLIEALAGLRELPWHLVCAGSTERDPTTAEAVARRIAEVGIAERIRLLGVLEPDAVAALYDEADLYVSPSFYEGYGMALAEALAHGLPIIAADGGAVAETVPAEAGLLVPVNDAAALRDALHRFMTDAALRERLRAGAIAARERLPGWQETAVRVAEALAARDVRA